MDCPLSRRMYGTALDFLFWTPLRTEKAEESQKAREDIWRLKKRFFKRIDARGEGLLACILRMEIKLI